MEPQMDTLKVVYKHYHHARLQKEEDEMWISSEDLRTEGSSDEETHHSNKKTKKQKKIPPRLPTTSSSTDTFTKQKHPSEQEFELKVNEYEEYTIDQESRATSHHPYLSDMIDSTPSTSAISLRSSDSDMDALNLESRWRPKRGSLKYPILIEGQTTENFIREFDGFYNEMKCKLTSLRNCPVMENLRNEDILEPNEANLFKNLKHTPAVQDKLKFIEKLDSDIKNTISTYKIEKSERLKIQNEMCTEIYKDNSFPERDTQFFLDICQFEVSEDNIEDNKALKELNNIIEIEQQKKTNSEDYFVKRNIELAKQGTMASYSLTDEEKRKLEELLYDNDESSRLEDNYKQNPKQLEAGSDITLESTDDDDDEVNQYLISNAYAINQDDERRINDINNELEKFAMDEKKKEATNKISSKLNENEWRDCLLEQSLKNIDAKLNELYKNDEEEEKITEDESLDDCDINSLSSSDHE